jgi:CRP/FNR family cyclic AMP-dependent transcriptional regulator
VSLASTLEVASLAHTALFTGLTDQQLERLRPHLRCRTFPSGTNVINVEQPGEVLFIIMSGTVKVQIEHEDGSEVILAVLGPGETVGEMSVTDKLGRSASVITLAETTLAWIDRITFIEYQQSIPRLTENVAYILSNRLRVANSHIHALATQDVYGRVARQLLTLADRYGRRDEAGSIVIPLRMTQADLASIVGASRVRVNQALVFFKDNGYISVDAALRITVHNYAALAARGR